MPQHHPRWRNLCKRQRTTTDLTFQRYNLGAIAQSATKCDGQVFGNVGLDATLYGLSPRGAWHARLAWQPLSHKVGIYVFEPLRNMLNVRNFPCCTVNFAQGWAKFVDAGSVVGLSCRAVLVHGTESFKSGPTFASPWPFAGPWPLACQASGLWLFEDGTSSQQSEIVRCFGTAPLRNTCRWWSAWPARNVAAPRLVVRE